MSDMILFESDFDSYPSAIIDTTCPNKSFLKYAQLLKQMGVKNHLWPLVLIHRDLKGLDPFDPNLDQELQMMFLKEFKINPWAFFRMAARATGSTYENPIYFEANRSNMAVYWLYFNHITTCLVQPRQTGKTFGINTLDDYLINIRNKGMRNMLLTKDEKLRSTSMAEVKSIAELLPYYAKQLTKNDIGNNEEINVKSLDNNYKAAVARSSPSDADKIGRGHKLDNTRFDETAYLLNVGISVPVMLAATTAQIKTAALLGNTFGNIFATTAGKRDDRDGKWAYDYFHTAAPWSEFMFDCKNLEELNNLVKSSSRDGKFLRVHCAFNHRQLGYTDAWLAEVAARNNSSGEAFERDYLNIWTSGSQNSPFSVSDTTRIRASEMEILFGEISRFGQIMLRWYIKEDQIRNIMATTYTVCAVDTSDGMGRDDIAVNIRNLKTGEVLAACTINEINLITVANFFVDLLKTYDKMTMIIERRNQAATIIDYMHKQMINLGMDPFKRLFNMCVQEHIEFEDRYKEILNPRNVQNENFLAQFKKFFGFTTSGGTGSTSRSELYGTTLRASVKYTAELIRDKPTIDQLLELVIRDGRVDHPKGGHDDLVVAWLLSYWFMAYGKNLQHYGIPSGYVLSTNRVVHSSNNREEIYNNELNQRAQAFIQRIAEQIKQERDPNVVERLIFEIENVKTILGPQNEVSLTVDEMINSLRKEKTHRYYAKRSIF